MAKKAKPEGTRQRQIREAISADLWGKFRELVEKTFKGSNPDDDHDFWPRSLSEAVSLFHEHLGGIGNNDRPFCRAFMEIFPPAPPKVYAFELGLTDDDRQKILDGLDEHCMSNEAKEQIKKALVAADEE